MTITWALSILVALLVANSAYLGWVVHSLATDRKKHMLALRMLNRKAARVDDLLKWSQEMTDSHNLLAEKVWLLESRQQQHVWYGRN